MTSRSDTHATYTHRRERPVQQAETSLATRCRAWLFARRYDEHVDRGVPVAAGTPLAAHLQRLTSRRERDDLAEALVLLLQDAEHQPASITASVRIPIRGEAVQQSADVVRDVLARLGDPLPVGVRGMARLRILLTDGSGPVYRTGTGSFAAAMRGVLAAL